MSNANQSAFPKLSGHEYKLNEGFNGLTKREYFASLAMQSICSNWLAFNNSGKPTGMDGCAELSIAMADELLIKLALTHSK